ncbi:MAG: serine/threonine protein kinase [Deltaproteobacteria bacterium]|nr:serine/threonine protein kinase [Deltaproteobacteria bacterium]
MSSGYCPFCGVTLPSPDDKRDCPSCAHEAPLQGWPRDPFVGRTINDKYRVRELLGHGGSGTAALAEHLHAGQVLGRVVLKFLHPQRTGDPLARRNLINEVRAARKIHSPYVAQVYDLDFDPLTGVPFIVVEYEPGQSLSTLLKQRGALSLPQALSVGEQLCCALDACHAAGVLHRDLSAKNVVVVGHSSAEIRVKLIDLGLAQIVDQTVEQLGGTPRYMPPEQIRGESLDEGVDLFALGVLLFECLTGQSPILVEGAHQLETNLDRQPRRLAELIDCPSALDGLLSSLMAKQRGARPPSARDVGRRLAQLQMIAVDRDAIALPARGLDAGVTQTLSAAVEPAKTRSRRQGLARRSWLLAAALLLALGIGSWQLIGRSGAGVSSTAAVRVATPIASQVDALEAADRSASRWTAPPVVRPTSPAVAAGKATSVAPRSGPANRPMRRQHRRSVERNALGVPKKDPPPVHDDYAIVPGGL